MKSEAFRYDFVSIPPARQIGCHSHPQWELSLVVRGSGSRTIGDHSGPIVRGEVILIPPYVPHVWRFSENDTDADGNITNVSVFFDSVTLDRLAAAVPEFRAVISRLRELSAAVEYTGVANERISSLLLSMRGLTSVARLPAMIELLSVMACTDGCRYAGRGTALSRTEQRLERVRVYCSCNYSRNITLAEIASYTGMNKSAFCTFMRHHAGRSLSEFINDIRLEKAREMLRTTDIHVADIAYDVGFSNVTYFNRLFRSRYHCTPGSIRKQ